MRNMTVFLICLLTAAGANAGNAGDLAVLGAWDYPPGVCRVIVRNNGAGAVDLSAPRIVGGQDAALPVLWTVADPPVVPPGGLSYVTYRFEPGRTGQSPGLERHVLHTEGTECSYAAPSKPPLAVTYLVFDEDRGRAYLYLRNPGPQARRVESVVLDGRRIEIGAPVDIEAGSVNLVLGRWEGPTQAPGGAPWSCVEVGIAGMGTAYLPGRLFRPDHAFAMPELDLSPTMRCVTHRYGPPYEAGKSAVSALHAASGSVRTLAFCNVDIVNDGPASYASLFERARIEPQPAFSDDCWVGNHVDPIRDSVQRTKTYSEPGVFYPIMLAEFIHRTGAPSFPISAFRDVAYTCLAAGAKGATIWCTHKTLWTQDFSYSLQHVSNELDRLQPLIAIAEPVPWVETDEDAWCAPHLLLCGDRGFLLILLPLRAHQGEGSAVVRLRIPDERWVPAEHAEEVGGLHETLRLDGDRTLVRAIVEGNGQTRVFFLPFRAKPGVAG
ncbi:MAG: hypothetical protein GY851_00810 [bacterium]|nr:hypothetical protein [bacterium]